MKVILIMKSWHYNYYKDKSVIQDLVDLLDEDRCLYIYTQYDCWIVENKDCIQVGEGAMMINSDDIIRIVNTNTITHVELYRSEELETNKHKDNLNDSEGE